MKDSFLVTQGILSEDLANLFDRTWIAVPNWKWVALAALIALGIFLRPLLRMGLGKMRRGLRGRQSAQGFFQHLFDLPLEYPWAWILVSLIWLSGIDALDLTPNLTKYLSLVVQLILAFHLIVLVYRSIEALQLLVEKIFQRTGTGLDQQIIPFITRTLQVLVVVLGILITLQNLGVNVVSILAGLGLGGLALALAAQDTAANVFGSITILFDRPFKIGDAIKVGSTEGVVEGIGFRSTRIRTPYNSLISIPNSVIAKEQVDNMESRPKRRVRQVLGILYETPPELIKAFTEEITDNLRAHPQVEKESVLVNFNNFGPSALDIQVIFHFPHITAADELKFTQEIFLGFLETAARLGVEFAYPTQTLYMKKESTDAQSGSDLTQAR